MFSIAVFYIYSIVYNTVCVSCFGLPSSFGVIQNTASTLTYWLVIPICCVAALLPRLVSLMSYIPQDKRLQLIFFRIIIRTAISIFNPDVVTKAIIARRRAARRGEGFLVTWSRSTSSSSIFR